MADPIQRKFAPLEYTRQTTAGMGLSTSLGQTLKSTFEQPLGGGLIGRAAQRIGADTQKFDTPEGERFRTRSLELNAEVTRLNRELMYALDDEEVENIQRRLATIRNEREIGRTRAIDEALELGIVKPPEELNEQYKDLGLTFTRPTTVEEARLIAQEKTAELKRQAIMSRGPQGLGPLAAQFGVAILATAFDPLELAANFVPVVGNARAARMIQKLGAVRGRIAIGAIEGSVGAAITEPLYYGLSRHAQLDYEMTDALFAVGVGTVLGGALGGAAGVLRRRGEGGISSSGPTTPQTPPAAGGQAGPRPEPAPPQTRAGDAPPDAPAIDIAATPEAPTGTPARRAGDATPDLPTSLRADEAGAALRQFVNDDPIDVTSIRRKDLRSTTSVGRVLGYDYQVPVSRTEPMDTRPTYVVADDEGELVFDTRSEAESIAAEIGGEVTTAAELNKFIITKQAEGDVLRRPNGEVASFRDEQQAERIAEGLREQGEIVDVIPRKQEGDYVIAKDLSEDDLESIRNTSSLIIPKGVDSRVASVKLADNDPLRAAITDAARNIATGREAEQEIAAEALRARAQAEKRSPEAQASQEVDETEFPEQDVEMIVADIERLESQLKEEGIFGEFDNEDSVTKFQKLPEHEAFYWPIVREAENLPLKKASADEWVNRLIKTGRVKKAEIEFSLLREKLERIEEVNGGPIPKEVVVRYLRSNMPKMRMDKFDRQQARLDLARSITGRREGTYEEIATAYFRETYEDYDTEDRYIVDEAVDLMDEVVDESLVSYIDYAEQGAGDANYQEFLIKSENVHGVGVNLGLEGARPYANVHFPGENIVAHVRTTDRVGPNGERVFFVEEFQSDWSSSMRKADATEKKLLAKYGSEDQVLKAVEKTRDLRHIEKIRDLDDFVKSFELDFARAVRSVTPSDALAVFRPGTDFGIFRMRSGPNGQRFEYDPDFERTLVSQIKETKEYKEAKKQFDTNAADAMAQIEEDGMLRKYGDYKRGVRSPFTNDLQYPLMVNRVIKHAVANGYDAIAWTNSSMQAKRGSSDPSKYAPVYESKVPKAFKKVAGVEPETKTLAFGDEQHQVPYVRINDRMREFAAGPAPMFQKVPIASIHLRPEIASDVHKQLRVELDRLGLTKVNLTMKKGAPWQGMFKARNAGPADIVIGASLDPMHTMHHETIHALRWMDVFTDAEWNALSRKATADWMGRYNIRERYPELSLDEQIEEAIAEAFADYAQTKRRPSAQTSKLLDRIWRVMEALRRVFKGLNHEDVFKSVYEGEVGNRSMTLEEMKQNREFVQMNQMAFHGGPEGIDEFHTDFIGTGEQKISKGWGLYFTDAEHMASFYAARRDQGAVYKVNIPDNPDLLSFTMKMSDQLPEVSQVFEKLLGNRYSPDMTGEQAYTTLSRVMRPDNWRDYPNPMESGHKAASLALRKEGILGHELTEGESSVFVVYDHNTVEIVQKEQRRLAHGPLTPETRAELDDLPEMEKRYDTWKRVVEVVADCVGAQP